MQPLNVQWIITLFTLDVLSDDFLGDNLWVDALFTLHSLNPQTPGCTVSML